MGYVGFASLIQVNSAIAANPALLQAGTNGDVLQSNSADVINRVAQYAFGPYAAQTGTGAANISAGHALLDAGAHAAEPGQRQHQHRGALAGLERGRGPHAAPRSSA